MGYLSSDCNPNPSKSPLKSISLQGFKIFQCYVEDISRYPQLDIPIPIRAMRQRVPLVSFSHCWTLLDKPIEHIGHHLRMIRSTTLRRRKHLIDLLYKPIFQVLDLNPILINEKCAHQPPPPINSQMRPPRAAVKNEIGQAGL